jgi:hypothetical protein
LVRVTSTNANKLSEARFILQTSNFVEINFMRQRLHCGTDWQDGHWIGGL